MFHAVTDYNTQLHVTTPDHMIYFKYTTAQDFPNSGNG